MENVLRAREDGNLVKAVLAAILEDRSDEEIIENIAHLAKQKQASKGVLTTLPEALRSCSDNIAQSLRTIADKVEEFTTKETTVLDDVKVSEVWDKFKHDKGANSISGTLLFSFNADLNEFKKEGTLDLTAVQVGSLKEMAFEYLKTEYPQMKASLDDAIFKSNLVVTDLEQGEAKVEYEIAGAY